MIGFAFGAHYIAAADWAMLGHLERLVTARVLRVLDDLHDFRNHVAAALDFDPVADLDAKLVDEIHVVQGRARDHGATNWHRLEPRDRGELSRPTDLRNYVFDLGDCAVCRELVGDGPARGFAGESQLLLERGAVDFYHDAVDLIRERFAFGFPTFNKLPDFG